jgi:hypothetical protein
MTRDTLGGQHMAAYPRHHTHASQSRSRAKLRRAKAKRRFVPRVIEGGKNRYLVALSDDNRCARLMVKGAENTMEAAVLFNETGSSGLDGVLSRVAVTDCETGLTHCFSVDFLSGTIA